VIDDLRYSARALIRAPLFSAAVVLTLAVGIGANLAVFAVIDALIVRSLPYQAPDRLASVVYRTGEGKSSASVPSPAFLAWRASSRTAESMTAYSTGEMGWLLRSGEPVRVPVAFISSDFFDVLGVKGVQLGRPLETTGEGVDVAPVVLISDRLWKGRFGGVSDVLGQTLRLNGRSHVIVGVAPSGLQFPDAAAPDVFLPLTLPPDSPVVRQINVIARLRERTSVDDAQHELIALTDQAAPMFPAAMSPLTARGDHAEVVPLQRQLLGDLRPVLLLALAAVGIVLLTACANVAGLLLARGTTREREFSTRIAVGATPARLARLVLAETFILTAASGVATLALLYWLMAPLRVTLAHIVPHAETIRVDSRAAAFVVAIVLFTSVACAAGPLLRLLRSGGASAAVGTLRFGTGHGMRRWFVAAQISTSFVLLLTGLLLLQTLWRLEAVNVGFDPSNVWTFRIPASTLQQPPAETQQRILDRISQVAGVVSAGASTAFPLDGHAFGFTIPVADQPPPPIGAQDATRVDAVSADYFRAMRIRVVEGRPFDERDAADSPPVAIVNRAFVRSVLIGPRSVGRRIGLGGGPQNATITVVGVVDDVKDGNPGDAVPPLVYRPFSQAAPQLGWHTLDVVVRTVPDPTAIARTARDAVRDVASTATVYDEMAMDSRVARVIAPQRQRAALFGLFAAAAVMLAIIGVYGLLNYSVTRELREFGIRLALGASPRAVFGQIVRRGAVPTTIGIVLGVLVARFVAALFARLLYGVTPTDTAAYLISAALMFALSLVASVVPARRAMRADPLTLFKVE
jgi:putative ABC transport system permease protein